MLKNWGILLLIAICIGLAGCNTSANAKETTDQLQENEQPIVQDGLREEDPQDLSFTLEEQTYKLTQKEFPILYQYINNFEDPEQTLKNLTYTQIQKDQFLVEFACHKNRCSHLLIDFKQKLSYLLSDISSLVSIQPSPEGNYVAFLFERLREDEPKHQLMVMDLQTVQTVELEAADGNVLAKPNYYQYAIQSVTFMNEEKIRIISEDPKEEVNDTITSQWIYQ
ncbi:hypothetical protein [Halobacillus litoralis]|uniref:hypothetical protein n=1 Tax=Halobacillus litoralis TaxID=45668 RepID=UPI001CFE88DE|nr:hypothetical protein [Halobacillus litoralis]